MDKLIRIEFPKVMHVKFNMNHWWNIQPQGLISLIT